jgi:hypothetical protein
MEFIIGHHIEKFKKSHHGLYARLKHGSSILAKAGKYSFYYPPHKWDGNEFKLSFVSSKYLSPY